MEVFISLLRFATFYYLPLLPSHYWCFRLVSLTDCHFPCCFHIQNTFRFSTLSASASWFLPTCPCSCHLPLLFHATYWWFLQLQVPLCHACLSGTVIFPGPPSWQESTAEQHGSWSVTVGYRHIQRLERLHGTCMFGRDWWRHNSDVATKPGWQIRSHGGHYTQSPVRASLFDCPHEEPMLELDAWLSPISDNDLTIRYFYRNVTRWKKPFFLQALSSYPWWQY